jgi:hypothetical protein
MGDNELPCEMPLEVSILSLHNPTAQVQPDHASPKEEIHFTIHSGVPDSWTHDV